MFICSVSLGILTHDSLLFFSSQPPVATTGSAVFGFIFQPCLELKHSAFSDCLLLYRILNKEADIVHCFSAS